MTKILVADDSAFMRKILSNILTKAGYKDLVEAADGGEAIEVYKKEKPDLVLMDIIMAPKDGIEGLKGIKSFNKGAKVIMVTAIGQETMINDAKKCGCSEYIIKPFKEEKVLEAVKKALGK